MDFKKGKGLHIDTFYHAKKFFQFNENARDVAKNLTDLIIAHLLEIENTTLVGFSNYTALYLIYTVEELKSRVKGLTQINYAVVDKDEDGFSYSFKPALNKKIIVVLPVTRTFERYYKIREFIEREDATVCVNNIFLNVFLIVDKDIN